MKNYKAGKNLLCDNIAANVVGAYDEFLSESNDSAYDFDDNFFT